MGVTLSNSARAFGKKSSIKDVSQCSWHATWESSVKCALSVQICQSSHIIHEPSHNPNENLSGEPALVIMAKWKVRWFWWPSVLSAYLFHHIVFSTPILTVPVMGGAGVPELTAENQFGGAAGFLIVRCQITFVKTPFSLLHFLVDHCRKHLHPSRALQTVWFSFWVLNQHFSCQVLAVVSRGVFHSFPGTRCLWNPVNASQLGQWSSKVQPVVIFIFNINKALGQEGMSYLPRPIASSLSQPAFWTKDDLACFSTLFQVVCWLLLSHLLCSQKTLSSYLCHPL